MSGIIQVNPNRQPIYPVENIQWVATLSTQVTGKNPSDQSVNPTLITPVLLGKASKSGAILYGVTAMALNNYTAPPGGGSGGGGSYAGIWGLGTTLDPVRLYFFTKKFGDTRFNMKGFLPLNAELEQQTYRWPYPILPAGQTAWLLEPEEELYVSVSKAIPTPGINVFIDGGHYSPT